MQRHFKGFQHRDAAEKRREALLLIQRSWLEAYRRRVIARRRQAQEAKRAQVAPHLHAGPVEWAANVQLCAAIPNLLVAETIETPFHAALIKDGLTVKGGYIGVPEGPGLGIEVDEELARAHPYDGEGLHLQMQEAPISYHGPNVFEGGAPPKVEE